MNPDTRFLAWKDDFNDAEIANQADAGALDSVRRQVQYLHLEAATIWMVIGARGVHQLLRKRRVEYEATNIVSPFLSFCLVNCYGQCHGPLSHDER